MDARYDPRDESLSNFELLFRTLAGREPRHIRVGDGLSPVFG